VSAFFDHSWLFKKRSVGKDRQHPKLKNMSEVIRPEAKGYIEASEAIRLAEVHESPPASQIREKRSPIDRSFNWRGYRD